MNLVLKFEKYLVPAVPRHDFRRPICRQPATMCGRPFPRDLKYQQQNWLGSTNQAWPSMDEYYAEAGGSSAGISRGVVRLGTIVRAIVICSTDQRRKSTDLSEFNQPLRTRRRNHEWDHSGQKPTGLRPLVAHSVQSCRCASQEHAPTHPEPVCFPRPPSLRQ